MINLHHRPIVNVLWHIGNCILRLKFTNLRKTNSFDRQNVIDSYSFLVRIYILRYFNWLIGLTFQRANISPTVSACLWSFVLKQCALLFKGTISHKMISSFIIITVYHVFIFFNKSWRFLSLVLESLSLCPPFMFNILSKIDLTIEF